MSEPRTERNKLAEAFIRGIQVGANEPDIAGDGDKMYQAFRNWIDERWSPPSPLEGRLEEINGMWWWGKGKRRLAISSNLDFALMWACLLLSKTTLEDVVKEMNTHGRI